MSTDTKTRLIWILSQLDNLNNGGNIRYEGGGTFQGARMELVNIIDTYVDNSTVPAPVNLVAMTPDQLKEAVGQLSVGAVAAMVDATRGITTSIGEMFKASAEGAEELNIVVLSAIAETRSDVLAAVAPAKEPAPVAQ